MKKLALTLAVLGTTAAAMADQAVVIKDTRSGTSMSGTPASDVLLTRIGQTCTLTEYRRSTDKPNEVALPVVNTRDFRCDVQGNPV